MIMAAGCGYGGLGQAIARKKSILVLLSLIMA